MKSSYIFFSLVMIIFSLQSMENNPNHSTTFWLTEEHLGKPIPLFGLLRNKQIGDQNALFVDFWGGEWVLAPLGPQKRLCAAIVEGLVFKNDFDPSDDDLRCRIITHKEFSLEKNHAVFSSLILPLTRIFLIKKFFSFDEAGKPFDYKGPIEQEICKEFSLYPPQKHKSIIQKPSLESTTTSQSSEKHHRHKVHLLSNFAFSPSCIQTENETSPTQQ